MTNRIEISSLIKKKTLALTFLVGAASFAFAQQKSEISGQVKDNSGMAVPYASLTFTNVADKKLADAVLTDDSGNFKIDLAPGNYEIAIDAIDFKKVTLTKQISSGNIGTITMQREKSATNNQTQEIQTVVFKATSTKPMKVEIDKKTYDVKSDITSVGGNLQDVLQNVPSVSVDTDGTVSMRGSSNVKFLVNGKPSALLGIDDGANALQAIPADQIDRIEVITNPSSKFDASGTAGILNIILKKNNKTGFNGSVTGTLGWLPRTSLNTNLGWKKGDWTWFVNGGGGYNENKPKNWTDTKFKTPDSDGNNRIYQETGGKNIGKNYNASGGFVFDISPKTSVNASGTVRSFEMENNQPIYYSYYRNSGNISGIRDSKGRNTNLGFQGDFGLDQKIDDKGQNLSLALSLQRNHSLSDGNIFEFEDNIFQLSNLTNQETTNKSLVGKADYELPIGEKSNLSAGYKLDINNNNYDFAVQEKGANDLTYHFIPRYVNTTDYKEVINAFYAQFKSKIDKFGYQIGLRNENTNVDINYINQAGGSDNISKTKKYTDFFPSVFLSYDLGKDNQLLLNYSRRIDRPRSFFLVPFMSYSDNKNIFRGNPDLDPSYIDSFELGYSISKKKFLLNPTLYFRKENQDVKMVVTYGYDKFLMKDVFNTMPANLGYDQRIGLDFNFTYDPFTWLKLMGEVDVYHYKTTGDYYYPYKDPVTTIEEIRQIPFAGNGYSTRIRFSPTFKIDKTFSIQLQNNYRASQKEGANDQKATYFMNLGMTKTIWKGDGTLAFNVQDVFNSRGRKTFYETDQYTKESFMQWQPQSFSLSLTYRFKQGAKIEQPKRRPASDQGGDDGQMQGM